MDNIERGQWCEASRLFKRLIDLDEPSRRRHIGHASSSPEVKAKLQAMLASKHRTHWLLDAGNDGLARLFGHSQPVNGDADPMCGRRIGDWVLLELLGHGGMATVYRGERTGHGFSQYAAIKLLGMAVRGSVEQSRFRREQRVLAQLQHPHITSLIDAGVADDGTPYLAMSLIIGERIDHYCDNHELDIASRVQLLLQVCGAVSYAHRQLVIHRDIKPGNILVDVNGHATLLDFGIARFLASDNIAGATITQAFSPDYAAPEQRSGSNVLGTPVDVYGMGAVLHRLLTGISPYHSVHGESKPASTVTTGLGRHQLTSVLRGDLDAILAQALATEPQQRYASIDALAADLSAWLHHRPVQARRANAWIRLRNLVRRNRLASALSAFALIAAASAIAITIVSRSQISKRASELQTVVRFQADMLQQAAPQKLGIRFRTRLSAALAKMPNINPAQRKAILGKLDFAGLGSDMLDNAVLTPATRTIYKHFSEQPQVQAMLLQTVANIYRSLFLVNKAKSIQDEATQLFRQTLGNSDPLTLASLREKVNLINLMEPADGESQIRKVLAQHEHYLGTDSVDTALAQVGLGAWLIDDDPKQAEALLRKSLARIKEIRGQDSTEAIDTRGDLAMAIASQGHFVEAEQQYIAAIKAARETYGAENPNTLDLMNGLAWIQGRLGHPGQAHALYRHIYDTDRRVFGDIHPRTLLELNNLAALPRRRGDYAGAEPLQRKAWVGMRKALGDDHPETLLLQMNLADICMHLGKFNEAVSLLKSALALQLPGNTLEIAQGQRLLGQTWQAMGKPEPAERAFNRSWQSALASHRKNEQRKTALAMVQLLEAQHKNSAELAMWQQRLSLLTESAI